MEEKQEEGTGVLVGAVRCPCGCGAPCIAFNVNDQRAVMSLDETLILFNQMGHLLETFGVLESDEDFEVRPCLQ